MDLQLGIKVLNSSATKYIVFQNEENTLDLQRQLDVFIVFTKSGPGKNVAELESTSVFITECAPKIVDILLQPDTTLETSKKILTLIQNLISSPVLMHELKTSLNLTSIIASFIQQNMNGVIDQCLDILQHLTYGISIPYSEPYLDDLIQFLIKRVQTVPIDELVQPCLTVITNMCRRNTVVQKIIRNKGNIKLFYRCLLGMLDASGQDMLIITALSAITTLTMNDDMGAKLFCANNLGYTLELVQNTIVHSNQTVQMYAIDLFMDLMAVEKMQQHFLRCKHFDSSITTFFRLLGETEDAKRISKIFELLLTLCSIPTIRRALSPVALKWAECGQDRSCNVLSITTKWIGHAEAESQWDAQLNALKYMLQLLKDPSLLQGTEIDQIEQLVTTISQNLSARWQPTLFNVSRICERRVQELSVLLELCENKNYASKIAELVDSNVCTTLVDSLLSHQIVDTCLGVKRRSGLVQTSQTEVTHVIVCTLALMVKIRSVNNGMEAKLYGYLQDPNFMKVLAESLISDSEHCVQKTLDLICLGKRLTDFPQTRLSRCIVSANADQKIQWKNVDQFQPNSPAPTVPGRISVESNTTASGMDYGPADERRVEMNDLIDKVEKGLQISDIKPSQIMEMYEHKLQSLEVKQRSLQDLLDAKSQALQQADRLMAQYRCRWAQSDAEALQLRNLLCESEKRSESAKEETTKSILSQQDLQKKIQALINDASKLDRKNEEQSNKLFEQLNKISALKETNASLEKELASLLDRNQVLQASNASSRQKAEEMTAKVGKLEVERKGLTKQLKERDLKLADINKTISNLENKAKCSDIENSKLKEKLKASIETCANHENDIKLARNEIAALENRCKDHQGTEVSLRAELEKYVGLAKSISGMMMNSGMMK